MKSTMALLALMCVAMATSLTVAEQTLSYPKCTTTGDTSKCCTLSASASMAHHGYFLAQIEGKETVVTCKAAALECHLGNPRLRATELNYNSVPCPDFAALFESRTGLEILEGVVESAATAANESESGVGQVKPATD